MLNNIFSSNKYWMNESSSLLNVYTRTRVHTHTHTHAHTHTHTHHTHTHKHTHTLYTNTHKTLCPHKTHTFFIIINHLKFSRIHNLRDIFDTMICPMKMALLLGSPSFRSVWNRVQWLLWINWPLLTIEIGSPEPIEFIAGCTRHGFSLSSLYVNLDI